MQIDINQSFAQIGLKITPPNLNLKTTQPDLHIKSTPADLALKIEPPDVIIDLSASFNSMGVQDMTSFTKSAADEGKQASIQGIERRVSEGWQMIEPHGPSVGHIIAEDSKPKEKELEIGLMPSVPPKNSAQLGSIQGKYTPAHVDAKLDLGKVSGDFTWGRVDIYMEREPYIDIKA